MKKLINQFWWTADQGKIKHCFVCGGGLTSRHVPLDNKARLVCRICFHITYSNPKSIAAVIPVSEDGRVALLRREFDPAKGKWSFPAGYQEWGETVEQAAIREAEEEMCVRVKIDRLLGVYSYPNSGILTVVYVGRLRKKTVPRAGHEATEARLFKPSEIPWRQLAFISTREALKDYMRFESIQKRTKS